jgi:KEOPS complex subunit Cgi121
MGMDMDIAVCWGAVPKGTKISGLLESAERLSSETGLTVQLFDAGAIAGEEHLLSAAMHALRAFERKSMRSSSVGMEMLLYASGKRQIKDAVALVGITDRTRNVAAALAGDGAAGKCGMLLKSLGLARLSEAEAAGGTGAIARLGIPTKGVAAEKLRELALEQVALLDIER